VVHYAVHANHPHLIVEAGKRALGCGMKAVASRFARAVQRAFGPGGSAVFGRYAMLILATQREVLHARCYVLLDARKHRFERHGVAPPVRLDEASSGRWFDGWSPAAGPPPGAGLTDVPEVSESRTFRQKGWRRHGLIRLDEVPGFTRAEQAETTCR
jgi:hypothetical protein